MPAVDPVGAAEPVLYLPGRACFGSGGPTAEALVVILGVERLTPSLGERHIGRLAGVLVPLGAQILVLASGVDGPDELRDRLRERAKVGLGCLGAGARLEDLGEEARVVDRGGRAAGDLLCERQIVGLEDAVGLGRGEADRAERASLDGERDTDVRAEPDLADELHV